MTRIIEITIGPDGQTKIETKGFAGGTCKEASRSLEDALGIRASEHHTAEYHTAQPVPQSNQQRI